MLVAAPERWDEACFALPAVRALVASGLGVGVLCREEQRPFWECEEGLSVTGFPGKSKARAMASLLTESWQASLAWEAGPAAEAFKIAAIPRRLGPDERKLGKLLTHPMGFSAGPLEHRVRFYLAAVEELGVETEKPEFFAPAELRIEPAPGAVMLCPGSDFGPNHEWPLDRWEEIAKRLLENGRSITLADIGGRTNSAKLLRDRLGDGVEIFDASALESVFPILAAHPLVISADGTLPHLAAWAGATCVTLFGPNDPLWKRPLGRKHLIVRGHVECAPCLLAKCPTDLRCQQELDVERVWSAILAEIG